MRLTWGASMEGADHGRGIVGDLASDPEPEFHELDPERVARTEAFGEVARRVPIAGAGHAEVHLGEQGDGSAGTAQKCRGRGAVLAPLDIPGRDPQRGRGRPDRDRLSALDLMQGRDQASRSIVTGSVVRSRCGSGQDGSSGLREVRD